MIRNGKILAVSYEVSFGRLPRNGNYFLSLTIVKMLFKRKYLVFDFDINNVPFSVFTWGMTYPSLAWSGSSGYQNIKP